MRRLLVVAAVLALTACGVPQDDAPRALDPAQAPFRVFSTEDPRPGGQGRVALYFVREDRVVLQTRAVDQSIDVDELLDMLAEGPTEQEVEAGTRSALPTTFAVDEVEVGPTGTAVVTLGGTTTQVSTPPLGFAQVVATLTAPRPREGRPLPARRPGPAGAARRRLADQRPARPRRLRRAAGARDAARLARARLTAPA